MNSLTEASLLALAKSIYSLILNVFVLCACAKLKQTRPQNPSGHVVTNISGWLWNERDSISLN